MATYLKVSEKQWVKAGMPADAFKKIVNKGHFPAWKSGGGIVLVDSNNDEFGFAKIKDGIAHPDLTFKSLYKQLVGMPFVIDGGVPDAPTTAAELSPFKVQMKTKDLPKEKIEQIKEGVNLSNVDDVGVSVQGTSSLYKVFLVSDDVNIAYRYTGSGLSIRAERFTKDAEKALAAWGLKIGSPNPRPYYSIHLSVNTKDIVARTLGSLAASVLTKAPTKQLSKAGI